MFRFAKDM